MHIHYIWQKLRTTMVHASPEERKGELEALVSKVNALEADGTDAGLADVLRAMIQEESHLISEHDHLKKAIDQVTFMVMDIKNKS
ncbi:hypothetical protein CENSYa_0511 [Cenarchaeum symbiosum A]|uniref:Uncharacterized protein n=1 Tax=Cenarchaeum symbiosum (strain A) TaxID=414004 RepID=A0RUX7_CENSY|nr:hypothetical protein CENSYa_0511 [Cenarchaeum symbiosum A]